jgi:hypothetical protein
MSTDLEQRAQAFTVMAEFHRVKHRLMSRYAGRYVAYYQGTVVDSDPDRSALAKRFYDRYGPVPVCIAKLVEPPDVMHLRTPVFPRRDKDPR